MKTLSTLALNLFLYLSLFASGQPQLDPPGCRSTFSFPAASLTLLEQVREDLLSGNWQSVPFSSPDYDNNVLQFSPDGYAYWFAGMTEAPESCLRYAWSLQLEGGITYLLLSNKNNQLKYVLQSTCEGIDLTDEQSGKTIAFMYQKGNSADSLARIIKSLIGKWEHSFLAPDIFVAEGLCATREQAKTAIFRYAFRADGTFSKGLHSDELGVDLIDEGRWKLSGDGKFILLERTETDAPYVELIRIKHLNLDELVLEQAPFFHKALAQAPSTDLFFNKI